MSNFQSVYQAITEYREQHEKTVNALVLDLYCEIENFLLNPANWFPVARPHVATGIASLLQALRQGAYDQDFIFVKRVLPVLSAAFVTRSAPFHDHELYHSMTPDAIESLKILIEACGDLAKSIYKLDWSQNMLGEYEYAEEQRPTKAEIAIESAYQDRRAIAA